MIVPFVEQLSVCLTRSSGEIPIILLTTEDEDARVQLSHLGIKIREVLTVITMIRELDEYEREIAEIYGVGTPKQETSNG
jgi:hypothetical protein